MIALTWSTTPPDRPGWWWRKSGHRVHCVNIVLAAWQGRFYCLLPGGAAPPLSEVQADAWAGPIPEPQETS